MRKVESFGADWVSEEIGELTEEIIKVTPSQYNEEVRYIPKSISNIPGYIRYAVNPFMREIVDCFDVDSDVREVNLKKGVQITYSTALESGALYYMGHVKTLSLMYISADLEMANHRVENYYLPMLEHSGLSHIIRSNDEGNSRKTGKTKKHLQFVGGGALYPRGANNADKMRADSVAILLKDEIDSWPDTVGKDGDPDKLTDARCKGFWESRKIFRGSTPLIKGTSKIEKAYLKGDQRKYNVLCIKCEYQQVLRWNTVNKENGVIGGFRWETDEGFLVKESVRYCCQNCGAPHTDDDKEILFSEEHGALWVPTARPSDIGIRSYHLPAFYSPIGMAPWSLLVSDYLEAWDTETNKVKDLALHQVFYNNVLAEPYEMFGSKIRFTSVSAHRRSAYCLGTIPNEYARQFSGSPILLLTCTVDVHKDNLAVSVMGWCKDFKCYIIDYWRFEVKEGEDFCSEISSPVWGRLRELIEEKEYVADDGKKYKIAVTLVDSSWKYDTVVSFCSDYASGVYPILGRDRPSKNQSVLEFAPFTTKAGTQGYRITVDHYKDRLATVLRREWVEAAGEQNKYHFNAPVNISDKQLKELTIEKRVEKVDERGNKSHSWYRPNGVDNELWDLLVYGSAAVEMVSYSICIEHFELEDTDWAKFWDYLENEKLYYTE